MIEGCQVLELLHAVSSSRKDSFMDLVVSRRCVLLRRNTDILCEQIDDLRIAVFKQIATEVNTNWLATYLPLKDIKFVLSSGFSRKSVYKLIMLMFMVSSIIGKFVKCRRGKWLRWPFLCRQFITSTRGRLLKAEDVQNCQRLSGALMSCDCGINLEGWLPLINMSQLMYLGLRDLKPLFS